MGIDRTIYLGVYIECQNELQEVQEITGYECCGYNYHSRDKFCKNCGGELRHAQIHFQTVKKRKIDTDDERLEDVLSYVNRMHCSRYEPEGLDKNIDIWISNCHMGQETLDFKYDVIAREISSEYITEKTKEFFEVYTEEIAILEKYYGEDKVKIKFGILTYDY